MTFNVWTYQKLLTQPSEAQARLFCQYPPDVRPDFDIVIVGSGFGGGVLADDLADEPAATKRILVLEAGSYIYPTHVFNLCRFPNASVAEKYECKTFWQAGGEHAQHYIHEEPQLNFGGRSIFWSGLIPTIQEWELRFFPDRVRADLAGGLLKDAGKAMNESVTMGDTAQEIVKELRKCAPLAEEFEIKETPRALHQPYLTEEGQPAKRYFLEPTGVFNTAELLINQVGLAPGVRKPDHTGLHILLNHYVEDLKRLGDDRLEVLARNVLTGEPRYFIAGVVVLAAGSIESPKLLARSTLAQSLPGHVTGLIGRGLTDHPTTHWLRTHATHIGDVGIRPDSHAKIVFYSRGLPGGANGTRYPFNVEMNVNHEYWHLRENDPGEREDDDAPAGASIVEVKFSFGNCLDPENEVKPAPPYGYVPEIRFSNLSWTDHLVGSRFPALAGWQKNDREVFDVLNHIARTIFGQFRIGGQPCAPEHDAKYGKDGRGFGLGTVHHAVGTLRMPYRARYNDAAMQPSVVDEDLKVVGTDNVYVCDMSVMPFSSAANPVRTLVALALRLSRRLRSA